MLSVDEQVAVSTTVGPSAFDRATIAPIVGVPMERAVSYAEEVMPWMLAIAQRGWPFAWLPYTRTDVARNYFAQHLLDNPQFTHLVMLDIDHAHPGNIVEQLCTAVKEDPAREIVASLYFRRGKPYDPLMFQSMDGGERYRAIVEWEEGSVVAVDRVATGAIIIARRVFEVLPWPWFAYVYQVRGEYPTEDVYFCDLATKFGIKVWCDTRIQPDHLHTGRINYAVHKAYMQQFGGENGGHQTTS